MMFINQTSVLRGMSCVALLLGLHVASGRPVTRHSYTNEEVEHMSRYQLIGGSSRRRLALMRCNKALREKGWICQTPYDPDNKLTPRCPNEKMHKEYNTTSFSPLDGQVTGSPSTAAGDVEAEDEKAAELLPTELRFECNVWNAHTERQISEPRDHKPLNGTKCFVKLRAEKENDEVRLRLDMGNSYGIRDYYLGYKTKYGTDTSFMWYLDGSNSLCLYFPAIRADKWDRHGKMFIKVANERARKLILRCATHPQVHGTHVNPETDGQGDEEGALTIRGQIDQTKAQAEAAYTELAKKEEERKRKLNEKYYTRQGNDIIH